MADTYQTMTLPATVEDLISWADNLKPGSVVEATVYNSFKKATGKIKVQRLIVHDGN